MNKRGLGTLFVVYLVASFLIGGSIVYGLGKAGIISFYQSPSSDERVIDNDRTSDIQETEYCGDGICKGDETEMGGPNGLCLEDCGCGNGKCDPGEKPENCKEDCCGYCGDGKCMGYACQEDNSSSKYYCPKQNGGDCGNVCGNGICEKGESVCLCAVDCKWQKCGDGECTAGDGGPEMCPQDCAAKCGDCVCAGGEDYTTCPNDCGYCGDKVCSNCSQLNENSRTCALDCV